MFNTKLEVDRHVDKCLKKTNSEVERNLRGLAFAKLYYKIGEFEQAHRYLTIYLNEKPSSAEGQNMLGKTLEKLNKATQALEAYKISLELDSKQNNLILKICELMAKEQSHFDPTVARYYCDKANKIDPNNPVIFHLKERLIAAASKDPSDVTNLLLVELESRPLDVDIRVRLLRHLVQNKRTRDAYTHAYDIEQKNLDVFLNNVKWYEAVVEVLGIYRSTNNVLTWEFWMMYVSVWEKLVALSLNERTRIIDYTPLVLAFDQTMQLASDKLAACPQKQLVQEFWRHYTGQLCWHFATLLYKQAKKELIKYREAGQIGIPLSFVSYHFKPADLNSLWLEHATTACKQQVQRWHREGAYRCTQAGNMLKSLAQDRKSTILERGNQGTTGLWREKTFKQLFITRENQNKIKSSYFVLTENLLEIQIRLPENEDLLAYTKTAQLIFPNSLHQHIWLGLNTNLSDFECTVFPGLQYTIKTLTNCAAETLNILDIQSFIYAAILCAKSHAEDQKHNVYYNSEKPNVLPIACTDLLGTMNQDKWLQCAYKMFNNLYNTEVSETRMTLIRGIETIRCVGNHGLDPKLIVQLARIFTERTAKVTKQSEIEGNEGRAELYWKSAMHLLEKYKRNEAISFGTNRLFDYKARDLTQEQIQQAINEGKLFLGKQAMKKKDYERALNYFKNVKDPYASFHQAQIYKTMADKETNLKQENVTSEMRSQNIILLTKARDSLYLTLDRLGMPGMDPKHPLNEVLGTEIEKIERLLSRIDPDNNRNECDGMSDDNVSSIESEHFNYTNRHDITQSHIHSTPFRMDSSRRDARPSPERLDAQIRQLAASKDMAMNRLIDQNKFMIDAQKLLAEELKSFRETVGDLATSINELKTLKIMVDDVKDIKKTVAELDSLRHVNDMVHELRKEVAELKRDKESGASANKSKPELSEEDLYVFDDDYAAEIASVHAASTLNSSMYPNVSSRMNQSVQNALGYPSSPGYPLGYPMYGYNMPGMGLPQVPGVLAPPTHPIDAAHLADYRTTMNLFQGYPQLGSAGLQQHSATAPPPVMGQPPSFLGPQYQQPHFSTQPTKLFDQSGASPVTGLSFGGLANTQNSLPTFSMPIMSTNNTPVISVPMSSTPTTTRAAPNNVVITSSDPLPKTTVTQQPILSVTIPPQHLKGNKVHNYQITLPSTMTTTTPSVLSQAPLVVSTQSILSNVSPPVYSALPESPPKASNSALGLQIEKSLNNSFNKTAESEGELFREEEHDPCPDFVPIIPLPDEVPVNTGEENENILFKERAKLFRYVNKEWKERGAGELKILQDKTTGKVRILMRRDQVHKICANHFLDSEMTISPMINNAKAYIWPAQDFADGEVVTETFCVQFKTPELGKKFFHEFERSKMLNKANSDKQSSSASVPSSSNLSTPGMVTIFANTATSAANNTVSTSMSTTNLNSSKTSSLGGFTFTSPPTFKPKEDEQQVILAAVKLSASEPIKTVASPFASFSFASTTTPSNKPFTFSQTTNQTKTISTPAPKNLFGSTAQTFSPKVSKTPTTETSKSENTSKVESPSKDDHVDEFVPTAEFTPVIPLPELIQVKTGEENAEVLFEHKGKLLRFESTTKEWKERGIGQMKILKDGNIVRLVMRREQVHKVCCNHQLLKSMTFSRLAKSQNAVTWGAKDFSEGVFTNETFALRFKTEDILQRFEEVVRDVQGQMDETNTIIDSESNSSPQKHSKPTTAPVQGGFGDTFKNKPGEWECKNCYVLNGAKVSRCAACETPKNDAVAKATVDDNNFCFGVKPKTSGASFSFAGKPTSTTTGTSGFGNLFKPQEGSWECKDCYTRNDVAAQKCVACEVSKPGFENATPTATTKNSSLTGVDLSTGGLSFSFGMPAKSANVGQTETDSTVSTTTNTTTKVGFGDQFKPKVGSWECKSCYTRNESDKTHCLSCEGPKDDTVAPKSTSSEPKGVDLSTGGLSFNFGMPSNTTTPQKPSLFSFAKLESPASAGFSFSLNTTENKETPEEEEETVFGSPHKVGFEFTPKSPRRQSSGQQNEEEGGDDSYYEEEEANVYFKPVIPLPDKIVVTTGEEEEEVLYCHRAKLYRHTAGEWKERGIGDLKILFKKEEQKLRVLMRREQVHKICLNHILTKEIKYTKKDDKTWLFHAPDFTEGEIEHCSFCLRFKTPEVADEFMKAINDALKRIGDETEFEGSDSDVEFISETLVTSEEEKEALKLELPRKYMAYRQLTDCTCVQCQKEKAEETKGSKSSFFSCGTPSATSVFGTPTNNKTGFSFGNTSGFSPFGSGSSTFGTPKAEKTTPASNVSTTVTPSAPDSSTKPDTIKDLLLKPAAFAKIPSSPIVSTPSTTSTFSFATAGTLPQTTTATTKSVFGGFATPPTQTTGGIFGQTAMTASPFSGGNLFGKNSTAAIPFSGGSLFGGTPTTNTVSAGTPTTTKSATGGTMFGGAGTMTSSFTGGNLFGGVKTSTPSANFSFAEIAKKAEEKTESPSTFGSKTFNTDESNVTFASLAASSDNMPFGKPKASTENPFASLGAGAPVFGAKSKVNTSKTEEGEGEDGDDDTEHDPHYEPIIPLPDEVEVKTGEEDEEVLFSERGKLYRFGNKEWKERGVGNIKILYHPKNKTYRLLLRREAVHKIVLNQRITADLDIKEFTLSSNAWSWFGMNYGEEGHALEQLAARFKNEAISHSFITAVQKAIAAVKEINNSPSAPEDATEGQASGGPVQNVSDDDEEKDDEDDEYDEEDDERTIMFSSECALYEQIGEEWVAVIDQGLAEVVYDREMEGVRVIISNDAGIPASNTLIAVNTNMERIPDPDGCELQWEAVEYAEERYDWRKLKMKFDTPQDAENFFMSYLEGKTFAEESNIVDEIPVEDDYGYAQESDES